MICVGAGIIRTRKADRSLVTFAVERHAVALVELGRAQGLGFRGPLGGWFKV